MVMFMPHIVLIEDESSIADTLSFILQREGFLVSWYGLAQEGLKRIEQGDVDLLILDVGLPDANGLDVLKQLRKTSELPVIMLTARGEEMDKVLGLELGADDYVVKPFSPREVAARVKTVLKRQASTANITAPANTTNLVSSSNAALNSNSNSSLTIASNSSHTTADLANSANSASHGFLLDEVGLRIYFLDQVLSLTPSEFKILRCLIQRPGKVWSRAQLLEELGDSALDSFERTVDTHIKSTRLKLKTIHAQYDPIETHRGFGYSLKPQLVLAS